MISRSITALIACSSLAVACSSPTGTNPPGGGTVASVVVSPTTLTFDALGVTEPLTAVVRNAEGDVLQNTVTWSVSQGNAVSVSTSGVVTAVSNGTATVRASAGGVTTDVAVTVSQVPVSISATGLPSTLSVLGARTALNGSVVDRNNRVVAGGAITWNSSNPAVLPIENGNTLVAARQGNAVITASAGGFMVEFPIAVTLTGPLGGPLLGSEVPCTGGMAGPFPCNNIKLMAYVPVSGVGASGNIELNDMWGWVDPQTSKEYAIVLRRDGTAFVDVTDPFNPAYLGFLPIPAGATPNAWHDVKVYANHAFIVADGAGPHGMQVFDLTTLRNVTIPRTFSVVTRYTSIASAHNIFINEATGFAYSVGGSSGGTTCGGGLHMINIQNPANPTFAGCFADPLTGRAGTGYTHDVQCVIYSGPDATYTGKEICFGSNETAINISNVTIKGAPVSIARGTYPGVAYTHQGWLTADQKYFLVNDELDEMQGSVAGTRTLVWDVTDLDDPVLVNQYLGPTNATDHNHYIRGTRMYMSNYQFGLRVVDVSNPLAPSQLGFFDTAPTLSNTPGFGGSWSNYPFFPSGNIVMSSSREGFFVLRMMN
jgi:choice-of-anchor B domain-containing protein